MDSFGAFFRLRFQRLPFRSRISVGNSKPPQSVVSYSHPPRPVRSLASQARRSIRPRLKPKKHKRQWQSTGVVSFWFSTSLSPFFPIRIIKPRHDDWTLGHIRQLRKFYQRLKFRDIRIGGIFKKVRLGGEDSLTLFFG